MIPWKTIEQVETPEGRLELRQRGERDFLITVGGRVLMTSAAHRSEDDLARLACTAMVRRPRPRVLIGGLGMAYTLRAALDQLPPAAEVTVVELNPVVVEWCRGPLAALTGDAVADRRVRVEIGDVAGAIAGARRGELDAILLDLYEGPRALPPHAKDPLYGAPAIDSAWSALRAGGVLAVWAEEPDRAYPQRLRAAGFTVEVREGGGRGGRAHVVYVGTRPEKSA
jgi:spermidine synthase